MYNNENQDNGPAALPAAWRDRLPFTNTFRGPADEDEAARPEQEIVAVTEPEEQLLTAADAPVGDALTDATAQRGTARRLLYAVGVAAGVLALALGAAYFWLGSGNGEAAHQVKPAPPSQSGAASGAPPVLTAEEIAQALHKPAAPQPTESLAGPPAVAGLRPTLNSGSPITDRLPQEDFSATVAPPGQATAPAPAVANTGSGHAAGFNAGLSAGDSSSGSDGTLSAAPTPAPDEITPPAVVHSLRVSQLRANEANRPVTPTAAPSPTAQNGDRPAVTAGVTSPASPPATPETAVVAAPASAASIALPPLGTLLPVRTLGAVYTLRPETPVRLELTRDVAGDGWALPRGTEFYGAVQGGEATTGRAFVTVLGFVEPATHRLVRLDGSLLGSDGADGVRGKTHRLNGGWRNTLKKVGNGLVDTLSAIASGAGRRSTVVIGGANGVTPRVVNPVTDEIGGLLDAEGRRAAGFIEIPAATSGYILIIPGKVLSAED